MQCKYDTLSDSACTKILVSIYVGSACVFLSSNGYEFSAIYPISSGVVKNLCPKISTQ